MKHSASKYCDFLPSGNFGRKSLFPSTLIIIFLVSLFFNGDLNAGNFPSKPAENQTEKIGSLNHDKADSGSGRYLITADGNLQHMVLPDSIRLIQTSDENTIRNQTRKQIDIVAPVCYNQILTGTSSVFYFTDGYPSFSYAALLKKSLSIRAGPRC